MAYRWQEVRPLVLPLLQGPHQILARTEGSVKKCVNIGLQETYLRNVWGGFIAAPLHRRILSEISLIHSTRLYPFCLSQHIFHILPLGVDAVI